MPGQPIRVINFGEVSWLDSQAIYHTVAHAFDSGSMDTITIMSPKSTYVSIGYFQELEKEVDIDYCTAHNIPIIRREVGGGAVLLDSNQLFFHFIFNQNKLPKDVSQIYRIFLEPVINAYKKMGLNVYHRPINDLHIDNKKIGGTGAAEIGKAMVVVGSFMFDFNYELMPRILKVPSEKFRDKVYQNVKDYVTNITKECNLKQLPLFTPDDISSVFLEEVKAAWKRPLVLEDKLKHKEAQELKSIRKRLTDKGWLYKKGKFLDRKVKINADINLYEGNYKCEGGLIRITCSTKNNNIEDINISGDFTLLPLDGLTFLENGLRGCPLEQEKIYEVTKSAYQKHGIRSPGVEPHHLAEAIKTVLSDCF